MAEASSTKVTDVAKPGTTPADPTSRPVIVGHGPMVADPMVNAEKSEESKTTLATTTGIGSSKPKINPVSSQEEESQDTAENKEKKLDEQIIEKKDTTEDKQARLGELIESGEYNVTIKQAKNGSARIFMSTVALVLLVGIILVYVLADLKVLDIGVKLPFSIFNKEEKNDEATASQSTATTGKATVTFPKTKITLQYDASVWKQKIEKADNPEAYFSDLTRIDDEQSFISLSEFPFEEKVASGSFVPCEDTQTCTAGVSDFTSEKIQGSKKNDLYVYSYIKKSASATSTRPYQVNLQVGNVPTVQSLNSKEKFKITASDKTAYKLSILSYVLPPGSTNAISGYATLAEAQEIIKSQKFIEAKNVLLSATD